MMRIGMLSLAVIVLSGCTMFQKNLPAPCGVTDYVETEVGTKITGVTLPTDETGKTYTIVTPKPGFWISMDCDKRIGR